MSDEAFIDTLVAGCSGSKGEGKEKKAAARLRDGPDSETTDEPAPEGLSLS